MHSTKKLTFTTLAVALILSLVGFGNAGQTQGDASGTNESTQSSSKETAEVQKFSPIVAEVPHAPIPFAGSDGRTHLVYELEATNFTSGKTAIKRLVVLDADTGDALATLNAREVAGRLQPAGLRETVDSFAPSMT